MRQLFRAFVLALLLMTSACSTTYTISQQGPWIWLQKNGEIVSRLYVGKNKKKETYIRAEMPREDGIPGPALTLAVSDAGVMNKAAQDTENEVTKLYVRDVQMPGSGWKREIEEKEPVKKQEPKTEVKKQGEKKAK
ncbi:MAG: hypothetical protein P1V97_09295 [Planctomycetota bacterium]|nr:hypothetical protein [Planctomycetota bacterium]